jgi:secondary thiamine-phosphate synthase enzyme
MKNYYCKEEFVTDEHTKFFDITERVIENVKKSGISFGHVVILPLHTTVGIYLNEGEERLLNDFVINLNYKVPQINGRYMHDDICKRNCPEDEPLNGHSHLKSAFYSNPMLTLILNDKILQLGVYQRILFAEFDGPCPRNLKEKRSYAISIIGE